MSEKRLTDVDGQYGYIGSPNRENFYSLRSLSDLYLLEAYKKFPNCEDKKRLSEYAKGKAVNEAIQKLGKHEDIEDKIGIDFITLSMAFDNGIYFKRENDICKTDINYICENRLGYRGYSLAAYDAEYPDINVWFWFKDYGKKEPGGWALTKEELE